MELTKEYIIKRLDEEMHRYKEGESSDIYNLFFKSPEDCDIEEKTVNYRVTVKSHQINTTGTMHGGVIFGTLDEAMAYTAYAFCVENGRYITSVDVTLNCLKALYEGDELVIKTKVVQNGKNLITVYAELWRGDEMCSFATERFARIREKQQNTNR